MNIPDDLKIFSFIYEYRFFALVTLYALWIAGGFYLFPGHLSIKEVFARHLVFFRKQNCIKHKTTNKKKVIGLISLRKIIFEDF